LKGKNEMTENFSLADIGAVLGNRETGGCFGGNSGGIVLIILFAIIFFFGGGGMFGGNRGGGFTQAEMQSGFNNSEVIGKLDRLGDGVSSLGYELNNMITGGFMGVQRDMCTGFSAINSAISAAAAQSQQCCCETNRNIDQLRYDGAMNTAAINANTTAQTQKILDAICGNRMADMQNQINQLQLQGALCGVVRYPTATTYSASNPFFSGCSCASV
jgi:hypothetical protein